MSVKMRSLRMLVVLIVLVVAASAAVAIAAAATFAQVASGARNPRSQVRHARLDLSTVAARHRAAARRDAVALIARLKLPAGAIRSATEPAGDHHLLASTGSLQAKLDRVGRHVWWIVPGTPASVTAAIRRHQPKGGYLVGTGGVSQPGARATSLEFQWRPVREVLGERLLDVTVTSLGRGRTGVLAESQSQWIKPRLASERIPAAARAIQIDSLAPGASDGGQLTVGRRAKVRRVVAIVNRLELVQPGVLACPGEPTPAQPIVLRFKTGSAGQTLAVLRYEDHAPWRDPLSDACAPITLRIGAHRPIELDGANAIRGIERVLGLRLT